MYPINTYRLHQIFNELDRNKDGHVSIEELMSLLERLGLHASGVELELLVGDKALNFFEFLFFYQTLINKENKYFQEKDRVLEPNRDDILESDLRKTFRVFDLNGDGFISCEELQIALARLGLLDWNCGQDCMKMIGAYDANLDGLLDFNEFKEMMFRDSLNSS